MRYKLCGLITDCYYVTLPAVAHAEITVVIANFGAQTFAILIFIRMNSYLGID